MDSRYQALIFDLYGTLVDVFSLNEHDAAVVAMADILRIPLSDFSPLWGEGTYTQRSNGTFTSIEENLASICRHLKIPSDQQRIQQAADVRYEFTRGSLKPKPEALELLTLLKQDGYRTGLVSNCAPDVPHLWHTTPLAQLIDVPIFSCQVKIRKPDPRIYRLVCERLRFAPQACLYVGDGSDRELTGAQQVGLSPVLVLTPLADAYDAQRPDVAVWDGHIVQSLNDIPTLL